jgi:FtsZ-binding cell division protein ZapB
MLEILIRKVELLQASNVKLHEDNIQLAEANRQLQATCNTFSETTAHLEEKVSELGDRLQSYLQRGPTMNNQPNASELQAQTAQTYAAAAAAPASASALPTGPKRPLFARHPKAERPARLLARLPTDHLARKASPIATLQKLRAELPDPLAAAVKTVQLIPTGVAITAHGNQPSVLGSI